MVITMIQLFNGETTFETIEQKKSLHTILKEFTAKDAAVQLSNMRGLHLMMSRSDLDIECSNSSRQDDLNE